MSDLIGLAVCALAVFAVVAIFWIASKSIGGGNG